MAGKGAGDAAGGGLLWWGVRKGAMTAGRLALVGLLYLCFCGWLLVS
ncbi:MAG: hypothetical protein ACRCYB_05165 [Aeromonas veronii]